MVLFEVPVQFSWSLQNALLWKNCGDVLPTGLFSYFGHTKRLSYRCFMSIVIFLLYLWLWTLKKMTFQDYTSSSWIKPLDCWCIVILPFPICGSLQVSNSTCHFSPWHKQNVAHFKGAVLLMKFYNGLQMSIMQKFTNFLLQFCCHKSIWGK